MHRLVEAHETRGDQLAAAARIEEALVGGNLRRPADAVRLFQRELAFDRLIVVDGETVGRGLLHGPAVIIAGRSAFKYMLCSIYICNRYAHGTPSSPLLRRRRRGRPH